MRHVHVIYAQGEYADAFSGPLITTSLRRAMECVNWAKNLGIPVLHEIRKTHGVCECRVSHSVATFTHNS